MPVAGVGVRVKVGHLVIIIIQVHHNSEAYTLEMGLADLLAGLFPYSLQSRHKYRQQQRDNGNYHQKLDQRKGFSTVHK
jgi:hypothetical protein